jgi:hypothetical protein
MPRTIFLYVLLVGLLVAGCAQSPTPEPLKTPAPEKPTTSSLPALDNEWTIKVGHSGGIMGLSRTVEISSDGKFTVADKRTNKTVSGELSAVELSKLNELVASSQYVSPSKPNGMVCADCFIYDLEIQADGKKFAVQLNDISLPDSGLEPLVTYLRELIDKALK